MTDCNLKITDGIQNCAQLTPEGALLVEGIEDWILGLTPMGEWIPTEPGYALRMVDSKTGAAFAVQRIKNE